MAMPLSNDQFHYLYYCSNVSPTSHLLEDCSNEFICLSLERNGLENVWLSESSGFFSIFSRNLWYSFHYHCLVLSALTVQRAWKLMEICVGMVTCFYNYIVIIIIIFLCNRSLSSRGPKTYHNHYCYQKISQSQWYCDSVSAAKQFSFCFVRWFHIGFLFTLSCFFCELNINNFTRVKRASGF